MAKAREIEGLAPGMPFAEAARAIVGVRAGEVVEQCERCTATPDATAVHDLRVACRRLRAVLEIFEPCFEAAAHRRALKAVKSLAGELGARRDLDVQLELLRRLAAEATAADRAGIESLATLLEGEVAAADERGAAALGDADEGRLEKRLAKVEAAVVL